MKNRSIWKGVVAGAVGGLAATIVMTQFQNGWTKVAERSNPASDENQKSQGQDDPSTVKMADRVFEIATGKHLSKEEKPFAGKLVHYGFGTLSGVVYGLLSEFVPKARAGFGSTFGSALFVGVDEIGVPLAGFSKPPSEYPAKVHLYTFASHLVYGTALEASRRAVRATLDKSKRRSIPARIANRLRRVA
jgi:uncharacterized membrane protein YagU involved in acid resistance